MSELTPAVDLPAAVRQLDELCCKVGLSRAEAIPRSRLEIQIPATAMLWSGAYAHILLWPLEATSATSLGAEANVAEGWFDDFLSSREGKSSRRALDGYLVLALREPPSSHEEDAVRRIEQSPRMCRKHLIWPNTSEHSTDAWHGITDITVLGLPEARMAAAGELVWPQIDSEAEALWADLDQLGVSATVQKDEAG